ncbi:TonB-dependent receptor [Zavarzinia compransoris]|uniref:TonB-dependent receptor plug domain-containing protein n=1 Tax=Zavarzinia marina TaxID=2911065 RepID=UPI001F2E5355|nr:TonB-dependent receptor [Zavarzinia marina]MCF4167637.1 TonB-dependent receptor [Zavarzinia marina]
MVRSKAFLLVTASAVAVAGAAQAEESVMLPMVSVTANRGDATPLTEVGSTVTVLTGEMLEAKQIRRVSDALKLVPGVSVTRTGTTGGLTGVSIRGAETNQTLVMIDGVVVNDPAADSSVDFAHILTADIERIEVLRGPQSALYGSDAVGGVVNIVTKRGTGKPSVSLSAEGGSRGTAAGSFSFNAGGEQYSILAGVAGGVTSGFSSASEARGATERDGYNSGTAYLKASFDPLPELGFDLVARATEFRREGDEGFGIEPGTGISITLDDPAGGEGRQSFLRGQTRFSLLDGHWTHRLGISRADSDVDYYGDIAGGTPTFTTRGTTTRYDYQTDYSFETPSLADATHTITLAAERREDDARIWSAFGSYLETSMDQDGYTGQYQVSLFDALSLTAAVRHDENDRFEDADTYRLTAAYFVDAWGTKFHVSQGTGVKNPTLLELHGYSNTFIGNPDLKPESARGFDVGVDQALWDDRVMVGVTYFRQSITDLISSESVAPGVSRPINLAGTSKIRGIEFEATVEPVTGLTLRGTYTYMDTEDAAGVELVRRPAHAGSVDVTYRFLDDRALANIGVVCQGEFTDRVFDSSFASRNVDMDGYTVVNAAASFDLTENFQLYGRVDNLFDEDYENVYSFGSDGRLAVAGVKATF